MTPASGVFDRQPARTDDPADLSFRLPSAMTMMPFMWPWKSPTMPFTLIAVLRRHQLPGVG